jgi:2-dehydro-3-deoxygalactonokinase
MPDSIRWIAVDWGSTHLRTYALSENNLLLDEKTSDKGMAQLTTQEFEPALLALISSWLPTMTPTKSNRPEPITVIACGMVGARQGWQEAPYLQTPCSATSIENMIDVETQDQRIDMKILAGVSQTHPADIMRGEETQIAGLLADTKNHTFSNTPPISTICLPGTHSKWVIIKNEKIEHFSTFMTGEAFSLLSEKSMLRHTVSTSDWDNAAFLEGVASSIEKPQDLLSNCFRLRASDLLNDLSAASARSRLSGLIIGAELAGAQPFCTGQTVALIGEPALSKLYSDALLSLGINSQRFDPKQLTLLGLTRAYQAYNA